MTRQRKPKRRQTRTSLQQAFARANRAGDVRAAVALAAPIAVETLWSAGVDFDDLLQNIVKLAGPHVFPEALWFDYGRHVSAAFALGLAMGAVTVGIQEKSR